MLSIYTIHSDKPLVSGQPPLRSGPRRLTLRMNFLWTLIGNVVYAASQWGILVVLAKLGTPQMVGEFALALAITAPVVIGAGLSLRGVQATDAASEYHFGDYLLLRLLTTGAAGLIIAGIVWLSGYGWHTAAIILIVGLAKGFESISDIFYGLLQQHERMDRIALSMMIKGLLSLAAVTGAVYLSGDLLLGACGLAAAWALILVFYDVSSGASVLQAASNLERPAIGLFSGLVRLLEPHRRPRVLATLTLLALPIGIVMALISFNANIPRYFIEQHLGTRELGIFAALAYPLAAGGTVVSALGQSAAPRLARHYADGDRRAFSSLLRKLLCLGLAVGAGGILLILLAGRPILLLLYQPEYGGRVSAFLWLGIAAGIGYPASLLGYGMTAARFLRAQLPVFLTVTLVTAAGCALLVPRHQLSGAAIAMVLAAICQAAGSAVVIGHALRSREVK
jgi:O-antigen/teichoic acid export membrane protein